MARSATETEYLMAVELVVSQAQTERLTVIEVGVCQALSKKNVSCWCLGTAVGWGDDGSRASIPRESSSY